MSRSASASNRSAIRCASPSLPAFLCHPSVLAQWCLITPADRGNPGVIEVELRGIGFDRGDDTIHPCFG